MGMSANFHGVSKMRAMKASATEWLEVVNNSGDSIAIFMPFPMACAIVDVFISATSRDPEVTRIMAEQDGAQ